MDCELAAFFDSNDSSVLKSEFWGLLKMVSNIPSCNRLSQLSHNTVLSPSHPYLTVEIGVGRYHWSNKRVDFEFHFLNRVHCRAVPR